MLFLAEAFVGGGAAPERQPYLPLELPVLVHGERVEDDLEQDGLDVLSADVADHALAGPGVHLAQRGDEHVVFGVEVVRHQARGAPGGLGDTPNGRGLEPFGGDDTPGGVDELGSAGGMVDDLRHGVILLFA